jgi:hypothetical protein
MNADKDFKDFHTQSVKIVVNHMDTLSHTQLLSLQILGILHQCNERVSQIRIARLMEMYNFTPTMVVPLV